MMVYLPWLATGVFRPWTLWPGGRVHRMSCTAAMRNHGGKGRA